MGFSPVEVDRMSMWQFFAACEGYRQAHDPEAGKELSNAEVDEIWAWMQGSD